MVRKKWSQDVTGNSDTMDLKNGVFKSTSPRKMADSLKHSAEIEPLPLGYVDAKFLYQPRRAPTQQAAESHPGKSQGRVAQGFSPRAKGLSETDEDNCMAYQLYYWDGIQGRGEFVRLALEENGADYIDVSRGRGPGKGMDAMLDIIKNGTQPLIPFAPPFLKDGALFVSHVANILMYLGPKLGLAPKDEPQRYVANGLQLLVTDLVSEVHDTHHPLSTGQYYEDQKDAAKLRSAAFIRERIPKYLGYFERVLQTNAAGPEHSVGDRLSYVDLSLFQVIEGLRYAFPRAMKGDNRRYPALIALHDAIAGRPNIVAYLQSERRLPFNEDGIFRHYPELDQDAA